MAYREVGALSVLSESGRDTGDGGEVEFLEDCQVRTSQIKLRQGLVSDLELAYATGLLEEREYSLPDLAWEIRPSRAEPVYICFAAKRASHNYRI